MPALDVYSPPKPKQPTGIPGLDDEEPMSDVPSVAAYQKEQLANRAAQQAVAIQRQQAQQSAAQERRQQADYDAAVQQRRNPTIPQIHGASVKSISVSPAGDRTYTMAPDQTEGMIFPSTLAAEEAGFSAEGADVLQDGRIRITKAARADRTRPAQKAVDTKYATDFVEWETGGASDAMKSIAQLKAAQKSLGSGQNLTGPMIGMAPDWALAWTNPQAIQTREAVEEVAQRNLRAVLGGQFAQKEGEQLIRRAFNPKLSEQENATRLNRLLTQIEAAAAAKNDAAKYFRENGTLTGWQGKMPSLTDFDPDAPGTGTPPAQPNAAPAPTATPQQPPVRMRTPGGQIILVPAQNVPAAQARGATPL